MAAPQITRDAKPSTPLFCFTGPSRRNSAFQCTDLRHQFSIAILQDDHSLLLRHRKPPSHHLSCAFRVPLAAACEKRLGELRTRPGILRTGPLRLVVDKALFELMHRLISVSEGHIEKTSCPHSCRKQSRNPLSLAPGKPTEQPLAGFAISEQCRRKSEPDSRMADLTGPTMNCRLIPRRDDGSSRDARQFKKLALGGKATQLCKLADGRACFKIEAEVAGFQGDEVTVEVFTACFLIPQFQLKPRSQSEVLSKPPSSFARIVLIRW